MPQNPPASTPPGWYADGSGKQSYWDGSSWHSVAATLRPASPQRTRPIFSGLAIAGFVLVLVAFANLAIIPILGLVAVVLGLLLALTGFVLAIVGLVEIRKRHRRGRGFAVAAFFIGFVVILLALSGIAGS